MNDNDNNNKFLSALKDEDSKESVSITENGARGYAKTNSRLVDFFFKVGSMRSMIADEIISNYMEAYAEDPRRALELLFFVRDCRGGMGEKRVFNICFDWLIKNYPGDACDLVKLIPEYGSWKTFFELTDSFKQNANLEKLANEIVIKQWNDDIVKCVPDGNISLMGKWMPSENTSSKVTRRLADYWRNVVKVTPRTYRKTLTMLRKKIKIVEGAMSAKDWSSIDYSSVPSIAGVKYRNAFQRNDTARYNDWLAKVLSGDGSEKINTGTLMIPEIVAKIRNVRDDDTLEAAWKDMVSKGQFSKETALLPIIDGSGSMDGPMLPGTNITPIDVAQGLGLYLANINQGVWRGKCIEFGGSPQFFEVPVDSSLGDQLLIARKYNDCANTDIERLFDLVLNAAVSHHLAQEDIPSLVVFSDMEFDEACYHRNPYHPRGGVSWFNGYEKVDKALFDTIAEKWAEKGYKLPKIFFWNICSRSHTIPMTENEAGVGLISGFNQSIMDMVLSAKMNPYDILIERLNSKRYDPIREALKD